jgi:hypothetical protein
MSAAAELTEAERAILLKRIEEKNSQREEENKHREKLLMSVLKEESKQPASPGRFSGALSLFATVSASVTKQLVQASQFAKEKVLRDVDVTELPAEYKSLEEKVDNIKLMHEMFLKVSRNYSYPHYDYEADITEKITDFASVVSSNAYTLANRYAGTNTRRDSIEADDKPASLSHCFAKAAYSSIELTEDESFKTALKKFGSTQERIGKSRIQQDNAVLMMFYHPLEAKMSSVIDEAIKSRRAVTAARLTYDSLRDRADIRSVSQLHAQQAKHDFLGQVETTMAKMKLVLEDGDALKCLSDLVAVQLQYHKAAFEALQDLSPILDELVLTNEAVSASGSVLDEQETLVSSE